MLVDASEGSALSMLERYEQINEHGFSIELDAKFYEKGERIQAAMFCINPTVYSWPIGWEKGFKDKIILKSQIERMIIASAFFSVRG
jgi:hypothetical protein